MVAAARIMSSRAPSRSLGAWLLALLLAASTGACGEGADPPGDVAASGPIVLYTSVPQAIIDRLVLVFEEAYPDADGRLWVGPAGAGTAGIQVEVVRASTGSLLERIAADEEAGGLQADVLWLADPAALETLKERGLLGSYVPPPDAPIPAEYVDPDGFYVAGRVINMVVAWNTVLLPDGLEDWPDLITAGHRRRAFPDPSSGAALAAMRAITDSFGHDFFARFASSGGRQVGSNRVARDAVAAGDYEAAAVLDYLVRQARDAGASIDLAYPASGAVVIPSPLAISATTGNRPAAEAFIDFILSRPGQELLVALGSFYPVRADVAPPPGAPPLADITAIPLDWTELRDTTDELTAIWDEAFRYVFQARS